MNVRVVSGNLLDQDVDVIVNAWNRNVVPWWLLIPRGVSGAIERHVGHAPFRELWRAGPIPLGGAVITNAGKLPHKGIIHVAGIDLLWGATERSIRGSVRSAITLARERGFRSIAFPLVRAGTGGLRKHGVLTLMEDELRRLVFDGEVRLVCYESRRRFWNDVVASLSSFAAMGFAFLAVVSSFVTIAAPEPTRPQVDSLVLAGLSVVAAAIGFRRLRPLRMSEICFAVAADAWVLFYGGW